MGFGYQHQQQYYGYHPNDGGMGSDSAQAQHQQRYAGHHESWGSQDDYPLHKQHMHMHMHAKRPPPPLPPPSSAAFGGGFGSHHQGSFDDGWHGSSAHHHGYPKKFGHNYSEEMDEYDRSYSEERYGGATGVTRHEDEMRFERHNYGFNSFMNTNVHAKPHYGFPPNDRWANRGV